MTPGECSEPPRMTWIGATGAWIGGVVVDVVSCDQIADASFGTKNPGIFKLPCAAFPTGCLFLIILDALVVEN